MITLSIVILLVAAIILFVAETLIVPGFGVCGVLGILLAGAGFYLSYENYGVMVSLAIAIVAIVIFGLMCLWLSKSTLIERLKLNSKINSKIKIETENKVKVGDQGVAITRMNLYGKVQINGETYEGKAQRFVDVDSEVEVIGIEENHLLVKQL